MKTVQWEIPVIITLFSSRHNKAIFMRFPDARTLRWDTVRIVKHLTLQRKIQFEPCVQTKYQIATSKCLCSAYFSTSKRWNCYATPTGGNCRTVYQDYHFSRHRWGQSDAILVTGLITPRTSEDWMFHGGPELSTVPSVPDQTMSLTGVSTSRQVLRLRCCSVSGGRWELHGVIKFCGGRPELSVTKWNCEFYSWKCFSGFSFKWEMFQELVWTFQIV